MTEGIILTADSQDCINYAMYQNGIPIVRSVTVTNNSGIVIDNAEITVRSEPPFLKPTSVKVSDMDIGHSLCLNPRDLAVPLTVIDDEYLVNISERLNGRIFIELVSNGAVISAFSKEIGILPYEDWPGMSEAAIIAAFVTPNSKSLAKIRSKASDALRYMHEVPSLEGYQSKDRQRVQNIVASVFSAFKTVNINYVSPPAGFEKTGQRIRTVDTVVSDREGTCIDLSVAFASAIESIGLNPIIVFLENHAFAGVWLEDDCFPDISTFDAASITRRVRNGEMCVVECTAMVSDNQSTFEDAKELAMKSLADDSVFECAIDIKRTRTIIKPLPLRYSSLGKYVVEREDMTYSPETPNKVTEDIKLADSKALTKLEMWERKLLDVSLKNTLIRLRRGKNLMPLMIGCSSRLEDELAQGKKYSILPKPQEWDGLDMFQKLPYESTSYVSNYKEGFDLEVSKGIIRTPLTDTETNNLLKSLYRDAKRDSEENGSNSLFLSLGVLKWYDESSPDEAIYAPLILIPVSITRSVSCYTLKMLDEEPIMNVTLLEKLSSEGIEIPGLDPLPEDESGIDVDLVFQTVRKCIGGKTGWDVIDSSFIGIFSFNQFVMWKDLTKFTNTLEGNKIVESLMNQQLSWEPEEIPTDSDPYGLCLTVPADSSQIRAVRASGEGISFVLHGPPGTGKSQTITNMISNALFSGKTVLFVAEKRAALEVVEKRLSAIGIANHCLELHSNRADKTAVLDQLRDAYTTVSEMSRDELDEKLKLVCRKRDALDQYVSNLHKMQPFGVSIYDAIEEFEKIDESKTFYKDITVPYQIIEAGKKELEDVCDAIDRMTAMYGLIDHSCEFRKFVLTRESKISFISDFEKAYHDIRDTNERISESIKKLKDKGVVFNLDEHDVGRFIATLDEIDLSVIPDVSKLEVYKSYKQYIQSYRTLIKKCESSDLDSANSVYEESKTLLNRMKADGAMKDLGPMEMLISRFGELNGKIAQVENAKNAMTNVWKIDTPVFDQNFGISQEWTKAANAGLFSKRKMKAAFMEAISSHLIRPLEFDDVKSTVVLVNEYGNRKKELDEVSSHVLDKNFIHTVNDSIESMERTVEMSDKVSAFSAEYNVNVTNIPPLKANSSQIAKDIQEYKDLVNYLRTSIAEASVLIGCDFNAYTFSESMAILNGLWAHVNEIQDWIEWNKCMDSMKGWGLEVLVEALNNGKDKSMIKDSFLKALYYRIIRDGISQSNNLRIFSSKQFEESIDEFRKMDKEYTECSKKMLRYQLSKQVPTNIDSYGDSENHILSRALQSTRMKMSIRTLFSKIPTLLTRICPCILMSPLSVSQYLSPEMPKFDLVIFDEASQIPTYKAVASLARAENAVIVGDPKQLPPTSFFDRKKEMDDEEEDLEDLESFLDDCLSLNMPQAYLEWHYRSKHESLICFSNRTYYNNRMLTFPSDNDIETRISLRLVDGLYERGKRINRVEAEAIADEVIARKKDPARCDESIGVITFNIAQQDLIEDLVIERIGRDGKLYEKVLGGNEPTFFKNIESVQGDERDVVLFSICFGPAGKERIIYQNFGPLNKAGGGRRLNVAVSRARKEMLVFSSMTADGIRPSSTSSDGVVNLKEFIRYAQNQGRFPDDAKITANESNHILADISREIGKIGYKTNFNVGNSEFRVDIGIVDPNDPARYLMGIISDGGSYRTASNTRDREYGRYDVLRNLGWNLFFVWSVEWLYKKDEVIAEIKRRLEEGHIQRPVQEPEPEQVEEEEESPTEGFNPYYSVGVKTVKRVCRWRRENDTFEPELRIANFKPPLQLSDIVPVAQYILENISPISDEYLAYCVQKIYGIPRMTGAYMDTVRAAMASSQMVVVMQYNNQGRIYTTYYKRGTPISVYGKYNVPAEGDQRPIQQLAIEEVISATIFVTATIPSSEKEALYMSVVRELGYARGGTKLKEIIYDAIDITTEKNYINLVDGRYVLNPMFNIGDITIDIETDEISEGLMKKKKSIDDFTDQKIKLAMTEVFTKGGELTKDEIFLGTAKQLGFKKISTKMTERFEAIFAEMFHTGLTDPEPDVPYEDDEPDDGSDGQEPPIN